MDTDHRPRCVTLTKHNTGTMTKITPRLEVYRWISALVTSRDAIYQVYGEFASNPDTLAIESFEERNMAILAHIIAMASLTEDEHREAERIKAAIAALPPSPAQSDSNSTPASQ